MPEPIMQYKENPSQALMEKIIKQYMPLIKNRARKFTGVDYDDLVQDGCIAIMSAVKFYDPSRLERFDGYVSRVVENAMRRSVSAIYTVHQYEVKMENMDEYAHVSEPHPQFTDNDMLFSMLNIPPIFAYAVYSDLSAISNGTSFDDCMPKTISRPAWHVHRTKGYAALKVDME